MHQLNVEAVDVVLVVADLDRTHCRVKDGPVSHSVQTIHGVVVALSAVAVIAKLLRGGEAEVNGLKGGDHVGRGQGCGKKCSGKHFQ